MTALPPLSPTARTTVTRGRHRAVADRARLHAFLAEALVAHVGVVVDDRPVVLPAAYAVDLDGPDDGGTLYLHGSVAAGWLRAAARAHVCVTVTELDGLVAARSGFHHSMNYRSVVVFGEAEAITDPDEKAAALDAIVEHVVPGRTTEVRPMRDDEVRGTLVLRLPLEEASTKVRSGGPVDDDADLGATDVWAGVLPAAVAFGTPAPDHLVPEDLHPPRSVVGYRRG